MRQKSHTYLFISNFTTADNNNEPAGLAVALTDPARLRYRCTFPQRSLSFEMSSVIVLWLCSICPMSCRRQVFSIEIRKEYLIFNLFMTFLVIVNYGMGTRSKKIVFLGSTIHFLEQKSVSLPHYVY